MGRAPCPPTSACPRGSPVGTVPTAFSFFSAWRLLSPLLGLPRISPSIIFHRFLTFPSALLPLQELRVIGVKELVIMLPASMLSTHLGRPYTSQPSNLFHIHWMCCLLPFLQVIRQQTLARTQSPPAPPRPPPPPPVTTLLYGEIRLLYIVLIKMPFAGK